MKAVAITVELNTNTMLKATIYRVHTKHWIRFFIFLLRNFVILCIFQSADVNCVSDLKSRNKHGINNKSLKLNELLNKNKQAADRQKEPKRNQRLFHRLRSLFFTWDRSSIDQQIVLPQSHRHLPSYK